MVLNSTLSPECVVLPKLPPACAWIRLPYVQEQRGCLTYAQGGQHIPFNIARVFWITHIPETAERGAHAHRTCSEIIIPVQGAFQVWLSDGKEETQVRLSDPSTGLLVPPMVWCRLTDFEPESVCLCFASTDYAPEGYINDFETFLKEIRH